MKIYQKLAAGGVFLAAVLTGAAAETSAPATVLTIDAGAAGVPVSPHLYGVFFEDINFAADGGLYAEKVQNRSLEFRRGTEGWGTNKAVLQPKVTTPKTGGLNPANVARAIGLLRPDVVDVSSGVEAALGEKSPAAVHAFVTAARVAALGADPVNAQES